MTQSSVTPDLLEAFREEVLGPVLVDGDDAYDASRALWDGTWDRRPGLIVQCMGVGDVQAALAFARTHDLVVAVRGGGHTFAGGSTLDGGLVIDLTLMRGVHVDPKARTAVAGPGTLFTEFDRETQVHGLATTGGMISHTGIAGLTLGGGMGRLMRKHGLTVDNVLSFDVVTADGVWRHVDEDTEPDLFWALRGGGPSFGVVTSFEYALHPLGPTVYGGYLGWPLDEAEAVLKRHRKTLADAPDLLQAEFLLTTAPEADFVPPAMQGKASLMLITTWLGDDHEEGAREIGRITEGIAPSLDLVGAFPYTMLQSGADALSLHGRRQYAIPSFFAEMTDEVIEISVAQMRKATHDRCLIELNLMGGAVSRVPAEDTPMGAFRDAPYFLLIGSSWDHDAAHETDTHVAWVRETDAALAAVQLGGRYTNFINEEDEDAFREAFDETTWARLSEIKAKYDPDGVFSYVPNNRTAVAAQPG